MKVLDYLECLNETETLGICLFLPQSYLSGSIVSETKQRQPPTIVPTQPYSSRLINKWEDIVGWRRGVEMGGVEQLDCSDWIDNERRRLHSNNL